MTCPHCGVTAQTFHDVGGSGGHVAREGCRGICMRCLMWWSYEGGQLVKYTPTIDEQVLVALARMKRESIARARLN